MTRSTSLAFIHSTALPLHLVQLRCASTGLVNHTRLAKRKVRSVSAPTGHTSMTFPLKSLSIACAVDSRLVSESILHLRMRLMLDDVALIHTPLIGYFVLIGALLAYIGPHSLGRCFNTVAGTIVFGPLALASLGSTWTYMLRYFAWSKQAAGKSSRPLDFSA